MNQTKYNFFKQIQYAVAKPMEYFRLTKVSGGRMTGFVFLFVLITSLFTIFPFLYGVTGPNGVTKYLREDIPKFELKDGQLSVDGRHEIKDDTSYVLVDTSVNEFSISDIDYSYYEAVLISKNNIVIYQNNTTKEFRFSDFNGFILNNDLLKKLVPAFYLMLGFSVVFIYLFMVGAYFLTALIYSLVGLVTASVIHINLPYGTVFKAAIYGKVTAGILSALLNVLPISLPGFITLLLSILITGTYVVYGTRSFLSDEAREEAGLNPPPQNPFL